ncbi:MAG TPA: rod shape-determining protein MreC [Terriglobales bacterium]|nr:rod shape-determining protein MreC [Terriglobales bacterium]
MESVLGRYRNLIVLVAVLFVQVLGLAVQVRRTTDTDSSRLIRVWAVTAVSPFEKALVWLQTSTGNIWHNYFYLRGVRSENRELRQQIEQMRIEQVRMSQDADQARRLQALLAFKEQFISQTMAAQVIGSSGSEQSRSIYIDKGERDGIKSDMAVITADGVVGKVLHVYRSVSLVLLISDQTSGVGAILEKSRLQGILRGMPSGEIGLEKVMSDEQVAAGEMVLTSGGDRIFPKGLALGRVTQVSPGSDLFLNIRVKPAANLSKLEEVLVVTRIDERQATPDLTGPVRAADILAERLPTVPPKSPESPSGTQGQRVPVPGTADSAKPGEAKPKTAVPGGATGNNAMAQKIPASSTAAGNSPEGGASGAVVVKVPQKAAKPAETKVPNTEPEPPAQDSPQ